MSTTLKISLSFQHNTLYISHSTEPFQLSYIVYNREIITCCVSRTAKAKIKKNDTTKNFVGLHDNFSLLTMVNNAISLERRSTVVSVFNKKMEIPKNVTYLRRRDLI